MTALDNEPISEVQLEIAFLSCLTRNKPIGFYKHTVILQLQNEIYHRTRVWLELGNLWSRLGEMYDLQGIEALNRTQRSPPPGYKPDPALRDSPLSIPKPPILPLLHTSPYASLSPILPSIENEKYQHENNHTDTTTIYTPSICIPPTPGFSPSEMSTPIFDDQSISGCDTAGMMSPIEGDDKAIRGRSRSTVLTPASGSGESTTGMLREASRSGTRSGGSETTVISVGSSNQTAHSHSPNKDAGKGKGSRAGTGGAPGGGKRWVSGRNGVHKPVVVGVVVSTGQKRREKRPGGTVREIGEGKSLIVSVPKVKKRKMD